ncbi:exodeoxyribonuclease I [Paraglaciecola polaris]|uniref:Exodeoxyribonuclease I n=1 Tax=Paraglaciecola polaris LMG 21857 TaxID=1129793 RepID=K7A9F1_9ALTE|nr:exodeoxyribonuclease I [Paraglaciecola polaris]GAC32045.1 exodeoxyribonuclease I [Paraglaciecola polaris LMG 21857]
MSSPSIFWHDYETWGVNPQKDPACQFAGIRTDLDLNIISKPLMIFNQIPNDYLPNPQACLITGITPQRSLRDGMIEPEFIAKIHHEFSQPNTCVAGYNNIRFDDEVTRYALYRNFYDPYAREWRNGNSRWDIIDVVRACYALRPDGIEWPLKEDGSPSFKLEDLSQANNIEHSAAHDAMSDVYATIGLAKLVKTVQPKLYDYLFNLRLKKNVIALFDLNNHTPLVHISSKLPALHGCCTWIAPIAQHPINKNAYIVVNLALDIRPLLSLTVDEIIAKLYTPSNMLEEGEQRLPIKLIHVNKSPVLAPAKSLSEDNAERLGINRATCLQNLQLLKQHPELVEKLITVHSENKPKAEHEADHALYSGAFFSPRDRDLMNQVIGCSPAQLADLTLPFEDPRLDTLLFYYKARNFPTTLNELELQRWQNHRKFRLLDEGSPSNITMSDYMQSLELLSQEHQTNNDKLAILKALYRYAEQL